MSLALGAYAFFGVIMYIGCALDSLEPSAFDTSNSYVCGLTLHLS